MGENGDHPAKGSIYKLTCATTGLSYVGQTRDTKSKAGKPYAYGVIGRWNDHVSCPSSTPLGIAIQTNGPGAFKVETLESDLPEERLDEREAYWIEALNTRTPNGYNKMRHGRCRHREESSLAEFYAPRTTGVHLKQIKRDGAPHLIYAYLHQKSGEDVRLVFGQGEGSSYAKAVADATDFLTAFEGVPIEADPRIFDGTASEYETKLARFDGVTISRIRVAKFNTMSAVYIDKERICFGGKKSTYEEAVKKALAFADALLQKHPEAIVIDDASKSATGGCSSS
jgi:hypothetical protein